MPLPKPIHFSHTISRAEDAVALGLCLRYTYLILTVIPVYYLALFAAAIFWLSPSAVSQSFPYWFSATFITLYSLVLAAFHWHATRNTIPRTPTTYTITAEGLHTQHPYRTSFSEWASFSREVETRRLLLLDIGLRWTIIPKREMTPEQLERVRHYIAHGIQNHANHTDAATAALHSRAQPPLTPEGRICPRLSKLDLPPDTPVYTIPIPVDATLRNSSIGKTPMSRRRKLRLILLNIFCVACITFAVSPRASSMPELLLLTGATLAGFLVIPFVILRYWTVKNFKHQHASVSPHMLHVEISPTHLTSFRPGVETRASWNAMGTLT